MRDLSIGGLLLVAGLALVACKTAQPGEDGAAALDAEPASAEQPTPADCVTTQAAALFAVKPGKDAVVEFGGVTLDREGQPLDPGAVDEVRLMFYALDADAFLAKLCGEGLKTQDVAYIVQEGELKQPTTTAFDSTPHAGRTATIELLSESKVRKFVFAKMDDTAETTAFVVVD